MSRRTPGMPIPGTEHTLTAAEQAAMLGLKPGAPQEADAPGLTPAQARKLMSDEYPGEAPDIGWEKITIRGGRDVMDALGVDPATLPVGVEAELGAPQPRPERHPESVTTTRTPSPPPVADADAKAKLAADFREHAEKVAAMAEDAKQSGDAAREAKAAAEVRASAEVGERLKARGVL